MMDLSQVKGKRYLPKLNRFGEDEQNRRNTSQESQSTRSYSHFKQHWSQQCKGWKDPSMARNLSSEDSEPSNNLMERVIPWEMADEDLLRRMESRVPNRKEERTEEQRLRRSKRKRPLEWIFKKRSKKPQPPVKKTFEEPQSITKKQEAAVGQCGDDREARIRAVRP
ncbi:hypothetical protein V3C99_004577 [Haemonchus contortus]